MLLDKIKYIILCLLIGAVLMNLYSYFRIAPTYTSVAKMYIVSASDDSVVDLTDLNIGKALTLDYEDLMLSYPVLDQVIEQLDLDMTSESLAGLISITNPTDTRILKITVTTTDAELSRRHCQYSGERIAGLSAQDHGNGTAKRCSGSPRGSS